MVLPLRSGAEWGRNGRFSYSKIGVFLLAFASVVGIVALQRGEQTPFTLHSHFHFLPAYRTRSTPNARVKQIAFPSPTALL
jgi:hypothetical protein